MQRSTYDKDSDVSRFDTSPAKLGEALGVMTSEPGGQSGADTGDSEPPQDWNQAARRKDAKADDDCVPLGTELEQPDPAAQETDVLAEARRAGQAILATERIDRTALYSPTALAALAVVAEEILSNSVDRGVIRRRDLPCAPVELHLDI